MAINVRSIFFSVKYALPYLRKNPPGYVVNIGSISSFVGQAGTPAYTASKAAVLGLSRSIALDYAAEGVRCNCVCPGITDTPMLRHHLEAGGLRRGTRTTPAPGATGAGPHIRRHCPCRSVLLVRGFRRHHRHVSGRRWRLPRRGRMGKLQGHSSGAISHESQTGLRRLRVSPAPARAGFAVDRHAWLRGRGHRAFRGAVAPLAVSRVQRREPIGGSDEAEGGRSGARAWPTSSCRWHLTFAHSPSTILNQNGARSAARMVPANARICRELQLRPRDGLARRFVRGGESR